MKVFFFILAIIISIKLTAQDDTTTVRLVFDYLNTEEFKIELRKFNNEQIEKFKKSKLEETQIKRLEKLQKASISIWVEKGNCFYPDGFFYKTDTLAKAKPSRDSLSFRSFVKTNSRINYLPASKSDCINSVYLKTYLLRSNIIEVRYFRGQQQMGKDRPILYGVEKRLRLSLDQNNRITILNAFQIFYN